MMMKICTTSLMSRVIRLMTITSRSMMTGDNQVDFHKHPYRVELVIVDDVKAPDTGALMRKWVHDLIEGEDVVFE